MSDGQNGISVIIHTLNNERFIRKCLESVKDFDEIVICDMYSSDRTLEIANEYNCKIVMHEKTGYVEPARNYAIAAASNKWVLLVDSDEAVTPELYSWLRKFVENPKDYTAVKIPRRNNYWGEFLEMEYPDYVTRFFLKDILFWPPEIHAQPLIDRGEIYTIPKENKELAYLHYTSSNIRDFINVVNRYTDYEVDKLIKKDVKLNILAAYFKSNWLIFEKFFLKKGYKNGIHGFILCCFRGFYKFLSYAKYWEYKKNNPSK